MKERQTLSRLYIIYIYCIYEIKYIIYLIYIYKSIYLYIEKERGIDKYWIIIIYIYVYIID